MAAHGVPNARMLAQSPTGELVLSQHFEGKVVKLTDHDGDGDVDEVAPILTGLDMPHGVAFIGETLFVAESDRVLRLDTWWDGSSARTDRPAARRRPPPDPDPDRRPGRQAVRLDRLLLRRLRGVRPVACCDLASRSGRRRA